MRPSLLRPVLATLVAIGAAGLSSPSPGGRTAFGGDAAPSPRPPEPAAPPSPVADEADWSTRDAEARWVLLRPSNATEDAWVAFLERRADPADRTVLEWLALSSRSSAPLEAMGRASPAAWMRVAVWRLEMSDSHAMESARSRLDRRGPEFLAWIRRFPAAETGGAAGLARALRARGVQPAGDDAVASYLPPLDPALVLRDLSPPAHLEDLGAAKAARDGVVYRSQVERAVDTLVATRLRTEPWLSRLCALLRHEDAPTRRAAALAFARFPSDLVPVDTLLALVDDPAQPADVRSAALLSAARSRHPKAYVRLCDVALEATHPARSAALSRLGEEADEASAAVLLAAAEGVGDVPRDGARAKAAAVLERTKAEGAATLADRAPLLLGRAAWAVLVDAPSRERLVPAVLSRLRESSSDPALRARLQRIASSSGGLVDAVSPDLAAGIRDLAQRVLDGETRPPR